MKQMKNIFLFLLTGVMISLLCSCQDVVQIKLDEGSKLYVIDAFVNNLGGTQTIRVTTNDSYFSNRQAPPVSGATVKLEDLTSGKTYAFEYAGNGNYTYNVAAGDSMAKVNHQYRLYITIDGSTYTSLTTQSRTAGIDSISVVDIGDSGFGPPSSDTAKTFFCMLYAKDKVDKNTDYYWVKTFRNDTLFNGSADINLSIDGTNGPVSDIGVDSTAFTPPITFLGFKPYKRGNTCRVEIHSLSHETYNFFVQANAQINNGGLFATTPENVKTNIVTPSGAKTRAIGWFNMATVATRSVAVP
jgi:hypothetical protein